MSGHTVQPEKTVTERWLFFFSCMNWQDENPSKCRCPVGICYPPAGRRMLLDFIEPCLRKKSPHSATQHYGEIFGFYQS